MIFLILILPAALFLLCCWVPTRVTFRVTAEKQGDIHKIFTGVQYDPYAPRIHASIDNLLARPFEDVYITSKDGLRLHGRFYPGSQSEPVNILFHGYMSIGVRDMSLSALDCLAQGQSVLLVDHRAHSQSQGKYLTFGILESEDCLGWVRYVKERLGQDKSVILTGLSMGASTVLLAASKVKDGSVNCVVADCGYSSAKRIQKKVIGNRHLPVELTYFFLKTGARLFCGLDLERGEIDQALRQCTVPVFIIHGDDDHFVPCSMTYENYAALPGDKELLIAKGAGHAMSFFSAEAEYRDRVHQFWKKYC